jgi:hypothetical protein
MAATDRIDEALRVAFLLTEDKTNTTENETILYFIFDISSRSGREDKMKAAFEGLKKEYSGSLEYRLAELTLNGTRTVRPFPSPSALLNPAGKTAGISSLEGKKIHSIPARTEERKTDPAAAIQTGSFSMKENAEYMVKDLKTYGFNPVIREEDRAGGEKIYKVLVPLDPHQRTIEETQHVLIRLKEKGVEGFLLFE